jgi:hypothetical protein
MMVHSLGLRCRWLTVVAAVVLAGVAGCAGKATLTGTVTYKANGKKLMSGSVMALGHDNVPRYGTINPDGSYAIDGVPLGRVTLTVTSPNPKGDGAARRRGPTGIVSAEDRSRSSAEAAAVPDEAVKGWFAIPDRYALPDTSGLKAVVRRGKNSHDVVLE